MEEDGLADAFRTGSAEGFRAVYERYSGAVYTVALRILGDRELAADAVQVTFLNAWRACGSLQPDRPLAPWLFTIARRADRPVPPSRPRAGAGRAEGRDGDRAVIEVNPGTGARTLISGRGQGSGSALQVPVSVAVEASGDILVADEGATAGTQLLRITPATGDRVVLSANGTGTGPTLTGSSLGLEGGVIYLMDQAGTIMSVDPVTGDRTLISGPTRGTGPGFAFPVSMASDSANSVVVLDMKQAPVGPGFGLGALIRVDLATGNRTVLSVDGTPKGSPVFDTPIDVRYDACENAFYVLQTGFGSPSEPGRVMKVDATTGTRSLFATYQGAENYALLLRPAPVKLPGGGAGQPSNQ